MSKTVSGRVTGNSGVSEKVSGTFCVFVLLCQSEKSVSNCVLSVLLVSKRGLRPLLQTKTLVETLFSRLILFEKTQLCQTLFSDTSKLPDTVLVIV